jgi:hypothetical protein
MDDASATIRVQRATAHIGHNYRHPI